MLCTNCGNSLNEGETFCDKCATTLNERQDAQQSEQVLIGFSSKITDPSFNEYKKKSIKWAFLFSAILAVIALVGFPIYGNKSGDIDWPNSLFYGMGIGGMFIAIALLQTIKRGLDKTWDGVVVNKDCYTVKERDNGHTSRHTIYKLKVQKDSGGTKKHKWRDIPGAYSYYNVGDKVRHHKGFSFYEKYDKSKDTKIMCAACLSFVDADKDTCPRCKCPLLK